MPDPSPLDNQIAILRAEARSPFGEAWRDYVASTEFNSLPPHDQALIRVAFVSGWRAALREGIPA